jgi:hypothetical protein
MAKKNVSERNLRISLCLSLLSNILLLSCTSNQKENYDLVEVGKLALPIDTLTKSVQTDAQVKGDTLFILNKDKNTLLIYDLEKQKQLQSITFEREGENGVGSLTGFYYHSQDSIFLLNAYAYKIHLLNTKKQRLHTYNLLKDGKVNSNSALPLSNFFAQMVKIDHKLHLATYPYLNPNKKEFYKTKRIHAVLDLKTDSFGYLPIVTYPESYQKNAYPSAFSFFFRTYNPHTKNFIYSFSADQNLQVNDLKTTKSYSANSTKVGNPKVLGEYTEDENLHIRVQKESPSYTFVLYDEYRKVYYRMAQKNEYDQSFVIIVLDENFKKIIEREFIFKKTEKQDDGGIVFPFVSKQGLCVPDPTEGSEDFFKLRIFRVVQKAE